MRRLLLCALLACSDEKPKKVVEESADRASEAANEAKQKALEVAEEAARQAERGAELARQAAEQAQAELRAAKDALANTSAEREKLKAEGLRVVAAAKEKLKSLEGVVEQLGKELEDAKQRVESAPTEEQKQAAREHVERLGKKLEETKTNAKRIAEMILDVERAQPR